MSQAQTSPKTDWRADYAPFRRRQLWQEYLTEKTEREADRAATPQRRKRRVRR